MKLNAQRWEQIRTVFRDAFHSSLHYAVATVNEIIRR